MSANDLYCIVYQTTKLSFSDCISLRGNYRHLWPRLYMIGDIMSVVLVKMSVDQTKFRNNGLMHALFYVEQAS